MENNKSCQPLLDIENVLAILNEISIFAGLTKTQLNTFFKHLQKLTFDDGQTVFSNGDKPSYIYVVQTGRVKLYIYEEDGTPLELTVFEKGRCFGEASVIGIQPHKGTAIAEGPTDLIVLSRQALLSIYDTDKEMFSVLIMNIAREACRRLHATEDILLHYHLLKKDS